MACKSFRSLEPFKTFQSCTKLFFFYIAQALQWMQKKRSLRSNSFFEEFPRVPFGKLQLTIYIFFPPRTLSDKCLGTSGKIRTKWAGFWGGYRMPALEISRRRPITPFGGPGTVWRLDSIRARLQWLWLEFESLISSCPGTNIDLSRFIISGRLSSSSHLYRARFPGNKYWSVISKAFLNETNEDG